MAAVDISVGAVTDVALSLPPREAVMWRKECVFLLQSLSARTLAPRPTGSSITLRVSGAAPGLGRASPGTCKAL